MVSLFTYFPVQVTNKFNVLVNTQRNGDKMTGYCNISPIKLTLSKPLLKVGFRKLKQNILFCIELNLLGLKQLANSLVVRK